MELSDKHAILRRNSSKALRADVCPPKPGLLRHERRRSRARLPLMAQAELAGAYGGRTWADIFLAGSCKAGSTFHIFCFLLDFVFVAMLTLKATHVERAVRPLKQEVEGEAKGRVNKEQNTETIYPRETIKPKQWPTL